MAKDGKPRANPRPETKLEVHGNVVNDKILATLYSEQDRADVMRLAATLEKHANQFTQNCLAQLQHQRFQHSQIHVETCNNQMEPCDSYLTGSPCSVSPGLLSISPYYPPSGWVRPLETPFGHHRGLFGVFGSPTPFTLGAREARFSTTSSWRQIDPHPSGDQHPGDFWY